LTSLLIQLCHLESIKKTGVPCSSCSRKQGSIGEERFAQQGRQKICRRAVYWQMASIRGRGALCKAGTASRHRVMLCSLAVGLCTLFLNRNPSIGLLTSHCTANNDYPSGGKVILCRANGRKTAAHRPALGLALLPKWLPDFPTYPLYYNLSCWSRSLFRRSTDSAEMFGLR